MNLENLNKWLSVISNIGVLIGIIFLSMEINQSNRIAERESRVSSVDQAFELQNLFLESPEISDLMLKLTDPNPNLNPREIILAEMVAQQLIHRSAALTINYESGFIADFSLQRGIRSTTRYIRRFPGLAVHLEEVMLDQGIGPEVNNPIVNAYWEEIRNVR